MFALSDNAQRTSRIYIFLDNEAEHSIPHYWKSRDKAF